MPDANETNAEPPKGNLVRRISGVLALIVMVVSSFMYIPEDAVAGEIFAGIFMGVGAGAGVLVLGWVVAYFLSRNTENTQK